VKYCEKIKLYIRKWKKKKKRKNSTEKRRRQSVEDGIHNPKDEDLSFKIENKVAWHEKGMNLFSFFFSVVTWFFYIRWLLRIGRQATLSSWRTAGKSGPTSLLAKESRLSAEDYSFLKLSATRNSGEDDD